MENVVVAARASGRWAWPVLVLYAGLIVAVSSIPAASMPQSDLLWSFDKLIHAAEYCLLGALAATALRTGGGPPPVVFALAALGCAAFGVVDELYQATVPGRFSSVYDALADAGGAVAGSAAVALWLPRWRRRQVRCD